MHVSFERIGRFGNNLFQYLAAKIIEKIYKDEPIGNGSHHINDWEWEELCLHYINNGTPKQLDRSEIHLHGFFQMSHVFNHFRDYLQSIINPENTDDIGQGIRVCDLCQNYSHTPGEKDIVIHFRLDDFRHDDNRVEILDPSVFTDILDTIEFNQLYIVCDTIRNDYEREYCAYFDKYNPIWQQKSLLEDFIFIKNATRVITSNSTFSWLPTFLSKTAKEIYVPKQSFHSHQKMWGIGENSICVEAKYYHS